MTYKMTHLSCSTQIPAPTLCTGFLLAMWKKYSPMAAPACSNGCISTAQRGAHSRVPCLTPSPFSSEATAAAAATTELLAPAPNAARAVASAPVKLSSLASPFPAAEEPSPSDIAAATVENFLGFLSARNGRRGDGAKRELSGQAWGRAAALRLRVGGWLRPCGSTFTRNDNHDVRRNSTVLVSCMLGDFGL